MPMLTSVDSNLCTIHRKRVTINSSDMRLAARLMRNLGVGPGDLGSMP